MGDAEQVIEAARRATARQSVANQCTGAAWKDTQAHNAGLNWLYDQLSRRQPVSSPATSAPFSAQSTGVKP